MKSSLYATVALLGLASCGTTGTDGSVATGPLGQDPLMTPEVQIAFRQGLNACVDVVSGRGVLSALQTHGFVARQRGYSVIIENSKVLGDSLVFVRQQRDTCIVAAEPLFPIEIQTITNITREAIDGKVDPANVRVRRSGSTLSAVLE